MLHPGKLIYWTWEGGREGGREGRVEIFQYSLAAYGRIMGAISFGYSGFV